MSIVLKAFPFGFLISPDAKEKIPGAKLDLQLERNSLKLIKVATDFKLEEINILMGILDIPCKYIDGTYFFDNGLQLRWQEYNGHYCAFLSVNDKLYRPAKKMDAATFLVRQSEELFNTFDIILKRNVRNIDSQEFFYYNYQTPYKTKDEIKEVLNKHKIENIISETDSEISFRYSNKNYKYIRANKGDSFYIESEQKVSLLNLGTGVPQVKSKTTVTNYTDRDVLVKTLEEYGATNIVSNDMNVICEMFGMIFTYSKDYAKGSYNLEINKISSDEKCAQMLADLDEEYSFNIQECTYKRILERIKSQNYRIENEEIEDDNSIVLTIDIG